MLCLDNNVVSRFLQGEDSAAEFLRDYEAETWTISSIVLYEAVEAAIHGYVDLDPPTVKQSLTASFEVLDVTERTAMETQSIQRALMERGLQMEHPDGLIVGSAAEHSGTFATAEKFYWRDDVQEVVDVAEYDPF